MGREGGSEMDPRVALLALYEHGYFEPTLFRLADGVIIGRFCLNDDATALVTPRWIGGLGSAD